MDADEALPRVSAALSGVPHVFVGAMGRLVWGRPRTTGDLDVQIAVDAAGWSRVCAAFAVVGLRLDDAWGPEDPGSEVPDHARFSFEDGFRVDVMLATTPFQREVVSRGVDVTYKGVPIRVETVEDLLVYKLIAGRPKDWDDIEDVVEGRVGAGLPIDWTYVERHAADWGLLEVVAALRARFRA
ncbi:MAG: hypothetical protein ACOZNI_34150 [Myxococcota bacterium]